MCNNTIPELLREFEGELALGVLDEGVVEVKVVVGLHDKDGLHAEHLELVDGLVGQDVVIQLTPVDPFLRIKFCV